MPPAAVLGCPPIPGDAFLPDDPVAALNAHLRLEDAQTTTSGATGVADAPRVACAVQGDGPSVLLDESFLLVGRRTH